jgi:hypothetical protein
METRFGLYQCKAQFGSILRSTQELPQNARHGQQQNGPPGFISRTGALLSAR